jgi:uncharacterized membrane protein
MSIGAWDVFAICALSLAWLTILTTPPQQLRRRAQEQDISRTLIFVFMVLAAGSSLFAVGFLLHSNKGEQHPSHQVVHLAFALVAVVGAWCLAHTVFGLRYAHTFYGNADGTGQQHAGGLDFPGGKEPDYMDFAYFSFVIGMTFQVSDVQVISRDMRQLVLLHGILSFGFNTVILALAINTAAAFL